MLKRFFALLLGFIIAGSLFTGCNKNKTEQAVDIIWTAPSTVKYMLEQEPDQSYGSVLDIKMAKNEYESAQLIVTPQKNIKNYSVTVSDLTDGNGNTILSENVQVFVEKYIEVKTVTTNLKAGFYPDAIVPLELIRQAGEDKIKKGQNQAFLLTVETDENTVAGDYTGKVTLQLNGESKIVDFKVKVYDFAITDQSHSYTSFGFWNDFFAYVTEDASDEVVNNYLKTLLKYRVSTIVGRIGHLDYDEMIDYYVEFLSQPECSCIGIPFTTVSAKTPSGKSYVTFDENYMRNFLSDIARASTNENNLISKLELSFSTYDEPKASQYEFVCLVSETFQNLKNEIAQDLTIFAPGVKDEVKQSLIKIPCVTTTNYQDVLARDFANGDYYGVDTWCGQFDYYDSALNRYYLQKQVEKGDGSWWYGCISPTNPYPSYHIDDNLLSSRLVNWMMMDYSITGNLYWCTNLWASYDGNYTYRDVWTEALAFPGANGDGYLIYPGDRYGLKDAIATIRLESIRDGMEDYEYLYTLKTLYEDLAKNYSINNFDFNDTIRDLYRSLYSGTIPFNDSKQFAKVKEQIMELIVLAEKGILVNYKTNYLNGKKDVEIYTPNTVDKIEIGGSEATSRKAGEGKVFISSAFVSGNAINATAYTANERISISRIVEAMGALVFSAQEENGLALVSVTDFSEYDDLNDVEISVSDDYAESGKSLKAHFINVQSISYQPGLIFSANKQSFSNAVRASVYNAQNQPVLLTVTVEDYDGKKVTLTSDVAYPNERRELYFTLIGNERLNGVKSITVKATNLEGFESFDLYFDNIALV